MTAPELTLDEAELRRLAESALAEDRADRDVTTAALVPEDQTGRGLIIAKAEGILAGLPIARAVAQTGVDFISMGAITHSAPALDMSLEVE